MIIQEKNNPAKFLYEKWYPKHGLGENSTSKEIELWLGKEKEYWKEGRFGLTGAHYFTLTQCHYQDGDGSVHRPIWRDVDDEELFGSFEQACSTQHDILYFKRRELGLTLLFGACVPIWKCFTSPNITALATSADKTRLVNMYQDKIQTVYREFDSRIKPPIAYYDKTNSSMHFGTKNEKTGEVDGLNAKYITMETVKNPKAMEAYRTPYAFIDEIFLHPKIDELYRSAQASTRKGFIKFGPLVMGGSAGETSAKGIGAGSTIWNNAEDLKVITVFIPGTRGITMAPTYDDNGKEIPNKYQNFCINGHSNEKAAEEWILRTRERLDKIEDKKFLNTFVKQYPLNVQEVLQSDGAGSLPKDLLDKVISRERIIISHPPAVERCSLTRDLEGKVQIVPDSQGRVRILQRPIEERVYIGGIDPIPFNTDQIGKGSQQVLVIKDRDMQRYVAWMMDRDSDPDLIVREQIMLQELFNNAKAMLEINRGSSTRDVYKNDNKIDLLARRPTLVGKGFVQGDGSIGFYKANGFVDETLNRFWLSYIRKYMDEIYFKEFLDNFKDWPDENCDIVDAMQACELYDQQLIKVYEKKNANVVKPQREIRVLKWVNGKPTYVWVKVRT